MLFVFCLIGTKSLWFMFLGWKESDFLETPPVWQPDGDDKTPVYPSIFLWIKQTKYNLLIASYAKLTISWQ